MGKERHHYAIQLSLLVAAMGLTSVGRNLTPIRFSPGWWTFEVLFWITVTVGTTLVIRWGSLVYDRLEALEEKNKYLEDRVNEGAARLLVAEAQLVGVITFCQGELANDLEGVSVDAMVATPIKAVS